jgi:hypothetical protein
MVSRWLSVWISDLPQRNKPERLPCITNTGFEVLYLLLYLSLRLWLL